MQRKVKKYCIGDAFLSILFWYRYIVPRYSEKIQKMYLDTYLADTRYDTPILWLQQILLYHSRIKGRFENQRVIRKSRMIWILIRIIHKIDSRIWNFWFTTSHRNSMRQALVFWLLVLFLPPKSLCSFALHHWRKQILTVRLFWKRRC